MRNGLVILFTGLCGAGKSTISDILAPAIDETGWHVEILDGDEIRKNITSDLGFSKEDRSENIKRISYVAKIVADCYCVAIVAAISPYKADREKAKELIGEDRFFEVFVECDINVLIERDVKGLYKKALSGEIKNFTGISDPYEVPERPNCIINSGIQTIEESVEIVKKDLNL